MLSWFHLTVETDTPSCATCRRTRAARPTGWPGSPSGSGSARPLRSRELFDLAEPMATLLRAIELGLFDTPAAAEALFRAGRRWPRTWHGDQQLAVGHRRTGQGAPSRHHHRPDSCPGRQRPARTRSCSWRASGVRAGPVGRCRRRAGDGSFQQRLPRMTWGTAATGTELPVSPFQELWQVESTPADHEMLLSPLRPAELEELPGRRRRRHARFGAGIGAGRPPAPGRA